MSDSAQRIAAAKNEISAFSDMYNRSAPAPSSLHRTLLRA